LTQEAGGILPGGQKEPPIDAVSSNSPAKPKSHSDWKLLCLLGLFALLLLLGLQAIEPYFFLRDDNATHFLGAYTYTYDSVVAEHELPLLNHHQFLGSTFLAVGQTGVFFAALYPVTAAFRWLGIDPRGLIDVLASLHLWLGCLGMWLLLRQLGVRRSLAFPLALCWCFLPFGVLVARSWVFVAYTMAFLPWNLWLLLRFFARPSARRGALVVGVKALFLLSGYVQYMVIASFFELVFLALLFLLQRRAGRFKKDALAVVAIFGLTALLAAPLLIPLFKAKEASAERAERLPTLRALSFSLGPIDFARTQLLYPREGALFRHGSSAIYFLGLPILLALGWAWRRRGQLGPFFLAAGLAGTFTLAMSTLLYYFLYLTPLFASLRWPFKNFPVAGFFLLLAAGGGAHLFAGENPRRRRVASSLLWLNLGMQLALLLVPAWRHPFGPHQLYRSVAALRASPLMEAIGDDGRAIALVSPEEKAFEPSPLRLGFLYATLAGKYHVAGYDPLLAQLNQELSPRVNFNTELVVAPANWQKQRGELERLSARYLLLSSHSPLRQTLEADPGLRLLAESEETLLFELASAWPIVVQLERRSSLPFHWRTNGIELELPAEFPGGHILFNVAALPGYEWWLDGAAQGIAKALEKRPTIEVPAGAHHIELRYRDSGFLLGSLGCVCGLVLLLVALRGNAAVQRFWTSAAPDAEHRLAEAVEK